MEKLNCWILTLFGLLTQINRPALKDEDRDVRQSPAEALEKINIEAEATEDAAFDFLYPSLVQKPPIFEAHFGHYLARFEC